MVTDRLRDREVQIGRRIVARSRPTFLIAEAGINHGGDPEEAKRLVAAAARSGAHAVKFQTYSAERRVAKTSPLFDILKRCELSYDEQRGLAELARDEGILFMSTPFDVDSVDFLAEVGSCAIKVASFDCTNLELVRRAVGTGLPVIVSTGMADVAEVDAVVDVLRPARGGFVLLHCVSAYPTPAEALNLSTVSFMAERYGAPIGFSDHTIGIDAPFWAVLAGAKMVEKHFTTDKNKPGPDHALSADPKDLREIAERLTLADRLLGLDPSPRTLPEEVGTLAFRRFSA